MQYLNLINDLSVVAKYCSDYALFVIYEFSSKPVREFISFAYSGYYTDRYNNYYCVNLRQILRPDKIINVIARPYFGVNRVKYYDTSIRRIKCLNCNHDTYIFESEYILMDLFHDCRAENIFMVGREYVSSIGGSSQYF